MNWKCCVLIFAVFAACPLVVCAADATTVISLNNDGVNALKSNNYALAIEKFKAALKLDPGYQLARDNLAIAHNNYGLQLRGNPKEALKQFHEALYLSRQNPTTLADVEGIIKIMGKDPNSFKDRVELGDQANDSADFMGAIIEYSEALKIKDDPAIHAKLGGVYRVRDENDKAIAEYQTALKLADNAHIEVKLGQAYQAKKDIPNALACYGKAIGFKSDDPEVQDALVAGWEEAMRENPLAPGNHVGLGQAFQYRGDFGQAEQEYQQAIRFSPGKNNPTAAALLRDLPKVKAAAAVNKHIDAGVDLQNRNQYDQALTEYQLAARADPRNDSVWVNIGTVYQALNKFDDALSAYKQALKLNPDNQKAQQGADEASHQRPIASPDESSSSPQIVEKPSGPSLSPEAQRFEAAKLMRQRQLAYTYVRTAQNSADKVWQGSHPPASGKLLVTKVKMTLDASGKISDYKVLAGGGSEPEDKSVHDCVNSVTFAALPPSLKTLDLYWTFMSDGSMNMVEFSDSSEANAYYTDLIGRSIRPNGTVGPTAFRARPDVDFGSWMADLQRRIKRAWFPPKGNESKRVVVVFKVHRGGELSNLRIDHSSGVAVADAAALKAIENAAPFSPLPPGASDDVDIQYTFDYNRGGHGTLRSF